MWSGFVLNRIGLGSDRVGLDLDLVDTVSDLDLIGLDWIGIGFGSDWTGIGSGRVGS